jgi:hypothetical protein
MAQYAMSIHSAESGADKLQGLMFLPATVDFVF